MSFSISIKHFTLLTEESESCFFWIWFFYFHFYSVDKSAGETNEHDEQPEILNSNGKSHFFTFSLLEFPSNNTKNKWRKWWKLQFSIFCYVIFKKNILFQHTTKLNFKKRIQTTDEQQHTKNISFHLKWISCRFSNSPWGRSEGVEKWK